MANGLASHTEPSGPASAVGAGEMVTIFESLTAFEHGILGEAVRVSVTSPELISAALGV